MRSGEHSYEIALALQRDRDLGARIRLARHIVRIESDVGGVVHLTGGRDASDHSGAFLEAMALAVKGAAANAGQHKFRFVALAQIQIDFDATE